MSEKNLIKGHEYNFELKTNIFTSKEKRQKAFKR
jgi:hypothetical protein